MLSLPAPRSLWRGYIQKTVLLAIAVAAPGLLGAQVRPGEGSYLGVSVADSNTEQGVQIVSVNQDSPASKAGLKPGDILLAYNGEQILGREQLGRLVWETPPGRQVKVQYLRDGKTVSATVKTAAAPLRVRSIQSEAQPPGPDLGMAWTDIPFPSIAWQNMLLGIVYEVLPQQLAPYFGVREGLLIRAVQGGSAADRAGLKAGDVLIELNGREIDERQDLSTALRAESIQGKPITAVVMRSHKRVPVTLQIG